MTTTDVDLSQTTLVDLLDRLLAGGVVISADVVLSVADVDLVQVKLLALVSSVRATQRERREDAP